MEDSGEGQKVNCMGNEMADRLDILMEILFKYIHEVTHMDGNFNWLLSCWNINMETSLSLLYIWFKRCFLTSEFEAF